jgi:nocturnin
MTSFDDVDLLQREIQKVDTGCGGGKKLIRVCQFNVLARCYATTGPRGFPHVKNEHVLDWHRRRHVLLAAILEHSPDIVCVEEMDEWEWISKQLGAAKFDGRYQRKSAKSSKDGVGILWNRDRFALKRFEAVELGKLCDDSSMTQVAVCVELDGGGGESSICIVATHLKAKLPFAEVRCRQVDALLKYVDEFVGTLPVVLCGDFNDMPTSEAVRRVAEHQSLSLASAYADVEGDTERHYTTFKVRETAMRHCIDYVFYSTRRLRCVARVAMPSAESIPYPHLPSLRWPSDHLSLVVDLALVD